MSHNNDLCLLIRQVRMPIRLQVPKQKKLPIFHKKAYTIPEKIYSDKEIMELYCKKCIKIDLEEQIVLQIVLTDEFINCKFIHLLRDIKYKLMNITSIEIAHQIICDKIKDDYQLLLYENKVLSIRQQMKETIQEFQNNCKTMIHERIQ